MALKLETETSAAVPEKSSTSEQKQNAQQQEEAITKKPKPHWLPLFNAWGTLVCHGAVSIAIALGIALAVNKYEALDDDGATHARYVNGRLILRVGDVTTIISTALIVVKLLVSTWTALAVWACIHHLYPTQTSLVTKSGNVESKQNKDAAFMMKWKLPPWMKPPFKTPGNLPDRSRPWYIAIALFLCAIQIFIAPLLTGAVNWTSMIVPSRDKPISIAAVDPRALWSSWYWYRFNVGGYADGISRKSYIRTAAGYASMAWGDPSIISENGTSLTGNGCRHMVVNNDALGLNSTLLDAVIPCIKVNSIKWYLPTDNDFTTRSSSLSLVDDDPSGYYEDGVTVIYNNALPWNDSQSADVKPVATLHTNPMTFWTMIKRVAVNNSKTPCAHINPTIFGSVDNLGRYELAWGDQYNKNCYWYGQINFTAGVTRSKESKYLSNRVVEDQTPLEEVIFEANPWVQESIWLLPDVMTMISVMNSTRIPTYENSEGYIEALLRQAYLAAWDTLHDSFDEDEKDLTYSVIQGISRQLADVTFSRVFTWLAMCLLMTISGFLLLVAVLKSDDLTISEELREEQKDERKDEALGWLKDMSDCFLAPLQKLF